LHEESAKISMGKRKRECAVLPLGNNRGAQIIM